LKELQSMMDFSIDQGVGHRFKLQWIDIDKFMNFYIYRKLLSWMRINLHYKNLRYNINKIYISLIWIEQNWLPKENGYFKMVRPLIETKNGVNSSGKSQTEGNEVRLQHYTYCYRKSRFLFLQKYMIHKLNLNFTKIEMFKELEHWL
jgi:hypothetical protein